MATRIQVRRDTAANWAAAPTTVLASGEIGFESDTLQFKIGDGAAQWQSLEYAGGTTPIIKNTGGTTITDLNDASLRNNGNGKYLFAGADPSLANEPSGLSTATDGQLMVTVAKYDYTGQTSSGNERFLMTLTTMTTGKTYYRTYNGGWSAWYLVITTDSSDNATVPGDLAVNGGDITTTSTGTATVFNTNATTLNVGEAATTVSIGATTGTATIRNATTAITGNATVGGSATVGTTLGVTGNTTLTGDLAVNGGDITTSAATATVFDSNATSVDIAGAATTLNIADAPTTNQTINIGTGATASGATKTINIGTGGATGSTTNVNLGDSDGGTVVVNRALTVNGQATLSGGLSLTGLLQSTNLPSNSLVKLGMAQITAQSVGPTAGATLSKTFSYTPALSSSTIRFLFITENYVVSATNGGGSSNISITFDTGSTGTATISNFTLPLTQLSAGTLTLEAGAYITQTNTSGSTRTYTINGSASGSNSNTVIFSNTSVLILETV